MLETVYITLSVMHPILLLDGFALNSTLGYPSCNWSDGMSSDCQGIDISKLISWLLLVSNYLVWQVLFGHLKEEKTEARIKGWRRKNRPNETCRKGTINSATFS